MEDVQLKLDDKGNGAFYIMDGKEQMGEMVIRISGANLTAFHTEVSPKAEGKGLAKKLLAAMADHARKNGLKVIPLCPFVHAQFKRHEQEYEDIWNREEEK
jgi:uncharacterized protein